MTDDRRQQLLDLASQATNLHEIEVAILTTLKERPKSTWCLGCDRMLLAIVEKAYGKEVLERVCHS